MNDSVAMTGKFSVESTEILRAWTEKAERQIFVIAEIGINHNGDIDLAKQMIDLAAEVGSDAVKFQKRTIDVSTRENFSIHHVRVPSVIRNGRKKKG